MENITAERLFNGNIIYQHADKFRFGTDPVLLAWFSCAKKSKNVYDLCSGTGIIPFLMCSDMKTAHFTALEIDQVCADIMRMSVKENRLEDRISVENTDLRLVKGHFECGRADLVTVNPPYTTFSSGVDPDRAKDARCEGLCTLTEVIGATEFLLKEGGRFCVVMRSDRTSELFCRMHEHRLEPKRAVFVQPTPDKQPYIVLCEGIKGGRTGITVGQNLVIYNKDGEYTDELKKIYRIEPYGEQT